MINLSLGHPIFESASTDPLVAAVEAAVRAGIVVVVAAGNYGMNPTGPAGYAGIVSPGNAPSAITVGSMNPKKTAARFDDRIDPYSSRGPSWYDGFAKPDVVAPGRTLTRPPRQGARSRPTIRRCSLPAHPGRGLHHAQRHQYGGGSRQRNRGRSRSKRTRSAYQNPHPALPPNAIKAILEFTGLTMTDGSGTAYDPLVQGMGAVNAAGAIAIATAIDTSVPSGGWWLASSVDLHTTIAGELMAGHN